MSEAAGRARRPRVAHVTTGHRADDVRIFERECRSLAACGQYDVYLAAAGSLPVDAQVTLIPMAPAPVSRAHRFTSGPRKAFGLSRALSADLWHFHDPELLPVALKLAASGTPVIWDAHEDYLAQFAHDGGKSWVPGPLRSVVRGGMKAMLQAVDRRAAGVVAATPTIAARYTNPHTVVVGNEARLDDFSGCAPDLASRRLLFTGASGPGHLFDEVVAAVEGLPDITLAVAGRDPKPAAWSAAEARLPGRIEHLGWLDRRGLCQAMTHSALGLATYANTEAYDMAAPTKVFEFCAAGLPVVASPNESNLRLVREGGGGFLADGFTADSLRRAIAAALSDADAWQAASDRGRQWAARAGSWEASERRLLEMYETILGGRRSASPRSGGDHAATRQHASPISEGRATSSDEARAG